MILFTHFQAPQFKMQKVGVYEYWPKIMLITSTNKCSQVTFIRCASLRATNPWINELLIISHCTDFAHCSVRSYEVNNSLSVLLTDNMACVIWINTAIHTKRWLMTSSEWAADDNSLYSPEEIQFSSFFHKDTDMSDVIFIRFFRSPIYKYSSCILWDLNVT